MPALQTQASTDIGVPMERVHAALVDFHTWPVWSPWLYLEPETEVTYRGEVAQPGHGYDWVGNKVGAGGMTLTDFDDQRIACDLQFLKPFKSFARVYFDLSEIEPGVTRITWHMDSRLPFFMFFMKNTMVGMIRSDYRRGLALLKDYLESGQIRSHSEFVGTVSVDECHFVGRRGNASLPTIADALEVAFEALDSAEQTAGFQRSGNALCFYDRMDYKSDSCSFTAALPVADGVPDPPSLMTGHRPACSALKVVHTGDYHHLGSAWAMLISESRHRKLKASRTVSPFEVYISDPAQVPGPERVTELFLPLRQ